MLMHHQLVFLQKIKTIYIIYNINIYIYYIYIRLIFSKITLLEMF